MLTIISVLVLLGVFTVALVYVMVSYKMLRRDVRAELISLSSVVRSAKNNWNGTAPGHQTLAVLGSWGLVLEVDSISGQGRYRKHQRPSDEAFARLIGL